jgi:hypothetical protein
MMYNDAHPCAYFTVQLIEQFQPSQVVACTSHRYTMLFLYLAVQSRLSIRCAMRQSLVYLVCLAKEERELTRSCSDGYDEYAHCSMNLHTKDVDYSVCTADMRFVTGVNYCHLHRLSWL